MPSQSKNPFTVKHRVGYSIASLFILWHVTAIVFVGPWPFENRAKNFLAPIFSTYIDTLRLGGKWRFYAPNVGLGSMLRYNVIMENGSRQKMRLTEALDRSDPAYYRYTTTYVYVPDYPAFRDDFLQYLCNEHADLSPVVIDLDQIQQRRLGHEDYLKGDRPLDTKYLGRVDIATYRCGVQQTL
jgi:hypothetical protein